LPKINSKEESAKKMLEIFDGNHGSERDISILNAAGAIYVGGVASSFEKGIDLATKSIDSGKAMEKLEKMIKFTGDENEFA
jgi:anthranilate phosphoribosyltransferase